MAPEKKMVDQDAVTQGGVIVRLLSLPVITATRDVIEKTYSSTKQSHPLICGVCGVYEKGAKTAGNLAVWSVQPVLHRLESQIAAVNSLACKGLDRIEEKIPALQYPPDKLASGIAEAVASTVQSAKHGITKPIISSSDKAFSMASSGYQITRSVVSDGVDYMLNSQPVRLVEEGADSALTLTEHLLNYILPASKEEMDKELLLEQESVVNPPGPQPIYRRLGALISTACRRAYDHTAMRLQHATSQGQELVYRIPGVSPMAGFAVRNLEAVGNGVMAIQSSAVGLFGGMESVKEKGMKGGELQKSAGVSNLGQLMQSTYVSVVSNVKNTSGATLDTAKDGTVSLLGVLSRAKERVLKTASQFGSLPGMTSERAEAARANKGDETETGVSTSQPHSSPASECPPSTPNDTQQVPELIPAQQKVVLGSQVNVPSQHDGKEEVGIRSHSYASASTPTRKGE